MLTPNRKGLSPIPSDIFYTQNMDTNYQIGLVWTRAPQFRFIMHPNDNWPVGLALENPQQYIGGGNGSGMITLPAAFASSTGIRNVPPACSRPGSVSSVQSQFNFGPGTANNVYANTSLATFRTSSPTFRRKSLSMALRAGAPCTSKLAGFISGFKDYILPSSGLRAALCRLPHGDRRRRRDQLESRAVQELPLD